jgi:hypothetical protein
LLLNWGTFADSRQPKTDAPTIKDRITDLLPMSSFLNSKRRIKKLDIKAMMAVNPTHHHGKTEGKVTRITFYCFT